MIKVDDETMQRALMDGLRSEMRQALSSSYGLGATLRRMIETVITDNADELEANLKIALKKSFESPEFVEMAQRELLSTMKSKFVGAFESVMIAAGKQAAKDRLLVAQMASTLSKEIPNADT